MTVAAYQRMCLLSQGGMGTVEVAALRADRFLHLYALKRPRAALRADAGFRAMFLDEARLAGLLRHPNVVPVLDVGEDTEGPYLAMEYVDGLPLAAILSTLAERGEVLPLSLCLEIAGQAARGLHAAHEARDDGGRPLDLVHRDVSPQNLLVGFDGLVRVADFGIAKALGNLAETGAGLLKGKLGYLAPEALRFEPLDRRADLYALGVVLYEMLAGRRLYDADDARAITHAILHDPPPDVLEARADAPDELAGLLFALLAKDRADRPATAREVAEQLAAIARGLGPDAGAGSGALAAYLAADFSDARRARAAAIQDGLRALAATPRRTDTTRRRRAVAVSAAAILVAGLAALAVVRADRAVPARGLHAVYFSDDALTTPAFSRVDPQLAFNWDVLSPSPSFRQRERFSVRWRGTLRAPRTERAEFCGRYDDGLRLWWDGEPVIDDWRADTSRFSCFSRDLRAGASHDLRVEYFQNDGLAVLELFWESPTITPPALVPPEVFSPAAAPL